MADHLSIGEVLALLREHFPDVTISKIRFLESQGLLVPERTPSGYRKFYEPDIERLRWILIQQRENFLPLKVIKDRLERNPGPGAPVDDERDAMVDGSVDDLVAQELTGATAGRESGSIGSSVPVWLAELAREGQRTRALAGGADTAASEALASEDRYEEDETAPGPSATRARPGATGGSGPGASPLRRGLPRPERRMATPLDSGPSTVNLTGTELASAAGLDHAMVKELEQYGLLVSRTIGDDRFYDADALVVAQKAAMFLQHGIGPRHLRLFKMAAEREAGLLEQVAMPLLKQRNPKTREQAIALLGELAQMGQGLRAALLRIALHDHIQPR